MARSAKKGPARDPNQKIIATNRRARHDFEILDTWECGLVLRGSEVKALREASVQIAEAYARVQNHEAWLHSLYITPYSHASDAFAHDPDRPRKLLLHRREIDEIADRLDREPLTLVPLALYFRDGRAKIEMGLARRKHKADKRADIAKRDADREARRALSDSLKGR